MLLLTVLGPILHQSNAMQWHIVFAPYDDCQISAEGHFLFVRVCMSVFLHLHLYILYLCICMCISCTLNGPISAERHFVYSCLYVCIYIYICIFSIRAFIFLYHQFEHLHFYILYLSICICTISCTLDGPISGESLFACLFARAVDRPISAGLTLFVPKRGLKSVNS